MNLKSSRSIRAHSNSRCYKRKDSNKVLSTDEKNNEFFLFKEEKKKKKKNQKVLFSKSSPFFSLKDKKIMPCEALESSHRPGIKKNRNKAIRTDSASLPPIMLQELLNQRPSAESNKETPIRMQLH